MFFFLFLFFDTPFLNFSFWRVILCGQDPDPPLRPEHACAPSALTTGRAHCRLPPQVHVIIAIVFKQDSCSIYNTGTNTSLVLSDPGTRGFLGCKSCMLTRFRGRPSRKSICVCAFVPLFLSLVCECFMLVCCIVWGCAAIIGRQPRTHFVRGSWVDT